MESTGGMILPILMVLLLGLGFIATLAFWLWMLIDCLKYEPSEGNDKIIWVLVIVFLHGLGALVYFVVRRQPRNAANGAT